MADLTKVVLDAMGGDHAPGEMVKGAVDAVSRRQDIKVFLVGQEAVVREELDKYTYPKEQIEVVGATEKSRRQSRQLWQSARRRIHRLLLG